VESKIKKYKMKNGNAVLGKQTYGQQETLLMPPRLSKETGMTVLHLRQCEFGILPFLKRPTPSSPTQHSRLFTPQFLWEE
jgi:hypothetical protein